MRRKIRVCTLYTAIAVLQLNACASAPRPAARPPEQAKTLMIKMKVALEALKNVDNTAAFGFESPQTAARELAANARLLQADYRASAPAEIAANPELLRKFSAFFDTVVGLALEAEAEAGHEQNALTSDKRKNLARLAARIDASAENAHLSFKPSHEPHSANVPTAEESTLDEISPIDRGRDNAAPEKLSGDESTRNHFALWNKGAFARKAVSASYDTVIVGGGMSGLVAYYHLHRLQPGKKILLLERASRLGGNSKGESWRGIEYSIGASYVGKPDEGEEIHSFLNDIGILSKMRPSGADDDPLYFNGKLLKKVWEKGTTPANKGQFVKLRAHFNKFLSPTGGLVYPQFPPPDAEHRRYLDELDKQSFKVYLERVVGGPLDRDLEALLDRYCWSALDARIGEVSAAAALNFFVGDSQGILVAPGGNAGIAEAILRKLAERVPLSRLRTDSLVFDVRVTDGNKGAEISFVDSRGEVTTVFAGTVIFAAPKFVAANIIEDLEAERVKAIKSLSYRSYLVANLLLEGEALLDKRGRPKFFDAYFVNTRGAQDGSFPAATDVVYGNFARPDRRRAALTIYRPLPDDRQRAALSTMDYAHLKESFENQIRGEILPSLGVATEKIASLRITRWAHPFPVARAGNLSRGLPDRISAPFRGVVFFANQDNWALPSFESLFASAKDAALAVSRRSE